MKNDKMFLVADNKTGIPYRNQVPMSTQECEQWIEHDIAECRKCGLDTITRNDYEIIETGGTDYVGI